MGLLDGLLGNASKIDTAAIQQEFAQVLAPGEVVEHAYKLIRDYFVFTNKRLAPSVTIVVRSSDTSPEGARGARR